MALVGIAEVQCDLRGRLAIDQPLARRDDAALVAIGDGAEADRFLESADQMEGAEPGEPAQIAQAKILEQIVIDIATGLLGRGGAGRIGAMRRDARLARRDDPAAPISILK